jgi:hypothetical protein
VLNVVRSKIERFKPFGDLPAALRLLRLTITLDVPTFTYSFTEVDSFVGELPLLSVCIT